MGKAGAELFAREGAAVAVVDIDAGKAEAVAGSIRQSGGTAHAITADLIGPGPCENPIVGLAT